MTDLGLTELALADLEILERALSADKIERLDAAALQALALGHLVGKLGPIEGQPATTVLPALQLVLAERRHRSCPQLELVWTGPEAGLRPARDTAVVVRELFSRARSQVLVGGFSFSHGRQIFAPLHRQMKDHGVKATLFLHVKRADEKQDLEEHTKKKISQFLSYNWPFGSPMPQLFFDPRTIPANAVISLHAKCIVVDHRWSLISSANLTDRGMHRNLEAGVLVDDPTFASHLSQQWLSLIETGQMQPFTP